MKVKFNFGVVLAMSSLFFAYGCSPTVFGDTTRPGVPPKTIITTDKASELMVASKADFVSTGETLDAKITMESGSVCHVSLKLQEMVKSYPVISIIPGLAANPYLLYTGNWDEKLPSDCLQMIQSTGGSFVKVTISEERTFFDDRMLSFCTNKNPDDLLCDSSLIYLVDLVDGVDN